MTDKPTGRFVKPLGEAKAPLVVLRSNDQLHRISCPYCLFGKANVVVTKRGPQDIQVDMKQTPICESCERPMRLRTRVILVGMPLEEVLQVDREKRPDIEPEGR